MTDDEEDPVVVWVGTDHSEIQHPGDLQHHVARYAAMTQDMLATLHADRIATLRQAERKIRRYSGKCARLVIRGKRKRILKRHGLPWSRLRPQGCVAHAPALTRALAPETAPRPRGCESRKKIKNPVQFIPEEIEPNRSHPQRSQCPPGLGRAKESLCPCQDPTLLYPKTIPTRQRPQPFAGRLEIAGHLPSSAKPTDRHYICLLCGCNIGNES